MQHANTLPSLACGMKSLMSADSAAADTQALWRFLNNPRVKPMDLAEPVLELARHGIEHGCDSYALAMHDWSRLNFNTHTSKRDRLRMTHEADVGYELQSTVLVADRDGSPIGSPSESLCCAHGVFSTRWQGAQPVRAHLEELSERMAWLDQQSLGRTCGAYRGPRGGLGGAPACMECPRQLVAGARQGGRPGAMGRTQSAVERSGRATAL